MNTVIVYGPQGCGKTRNAEALRNHFGCSNIVDGWDTGEALTPGALHLSNDDSLQGLHSCSRRIAHSKRVMDANVYSFEDALKERDAALRARAVEQGLLPSTEKATNPKDAVGVRKWRQFATIPFTVICEIGVAMMEGALKYGRHNYRVAGVRASVYKDAAVGHIMCWWEGEDLDPDTKLSHITKAIASLIVLRDAMIQRKLNDDRPPKGNLDEVRANLQTVVDAMFEKYPEPKDAFTEIGVRNGQGITQLRVNGSLSPETIDALRAGGSESQRLVPRRLIANAVSFGDGGIVDGNKR